MSRRIKLVDTATFWKHVYNYSAQERMTEGLKFLIYGEKVYHHLGNRRRPLYRLLKRYLDERER